MGGISVRVQSMVRNGGALSEVSCVFCGQWPYFNIFWYVSASINLNVSGCVLFFTPILNQTIQESCL